MSATISPVSLSRVYATGRTFVSEMKATSMEAKSRGSPIISGVTVRMFVRSMLRTRASVRSFQASWP